MRTTAGVVGDGLTRPLIGDLLRSEIRVPREAAESIQICECQWRAEPCLPTDAGDADHTTLAGQYLLDWRIVTADAHVEVENLLPHGCEIDEVTLLAGVLLRDLDLHGLAGLREAAEEGRDGLAGLEVDGAFLGLDDDVGRELAVERMEDVVGGAGAVGLGVVPVEVVVVDEGAVENDAAVRSERSGEGVGGIGGGAAKAGGTGLAFGVGLYREAGEVGDEGVDFVDLGGPPVLHCRIERIVGVEAADLLRTGDIDGEGDRGRRRVASRRRSSRLLRAFAA